MSSGFTILGCARLSGSEMVQWDHVDFITYSAEASDAYCAADTDRCTFCGHLWFLYAFTGKSKNPERWIATDAGMDKISTKIAGKIAGSLEKRLKKAYPKARKIEEEIREENKEKIFCKRVRLYKIVMLFMIGAFLGDITETIFCRVTAGVWMSRSSVVWGPFSIVWGLAIALVTALLYKYKDKGDRFLFLTGTLLGGAYEYFCSVFTELVFGKVFWDYSKIPFNLGGRINLLYCFFWGIAAVVWFKILFPPVEKWIEKKILAVAGKILTWFYWDLWFATFWYPVWHW